MEIAWKVLLELSSGLLLLCCGLCNGLPINLENTVADSHTQLLTGLVAVLLTVCSVVFLAGCLCCQRRNGFKEFRDSPVVASTASNLEDHGHVNPVANGEFTIFTPLSPPHQNNNVFLANQQIINRTQEDYSHGDVDVSSWFNGTETDFPRIKLKYIKEIGKGWFGRVVEGTAQDISPDQKWTPVVVRILEATASSKERVVFLHDAAIYRCGSHPNVMKLLGRCLDTVPLLLMQEYCLQGDLKKYLRQNQSTADQLLSSEYPLVWCCQLTSALKHLHDNRLTHPDLAARNCQLTSNLTLKLGDYGMAVFQYPGDYYQGAPGVPVRWCAPESLSFTSTTIQPKKVTAEANIWSLAVTLWEICECGRQPYGDLSDDEVISQVLGTSNVRLSRPKCQVLYTDYIFRLMQLCWTSAESRPAVSQIDLMLADLLQVHKHTQSNEEEESLQSPEDFDRRWESFKPNTIVKTDNHVDDEITISKPLSPSMNNLHGSLDNLVHQQQQQENQMESWLENVATKTGDMSFVQGLSDAMKDLDNALALENGSSSDSSHQQSPAPQDLKPKPRIEFKLGLPFRNRHTEPGFNQNDPYSLNDNSLMFMRNSSGSETEEENWKKKIERGAYSEKVRQKSRSVADLMVLTHIDPSESESETPLPSLDFTKANYKNVRYAALAPKQNLESMSLMYGSEGNLLSVQETFQEELRKLQEEQRKDNSLLFVPEKRSSVSDSSNALCEDSPSKRLLQELNSPSEIKPANQVFNVFNVTIDKFSPVHVKAASHFAEFNGTSSQQVPKLSHLIQSQLELRTGFVDESKQPFVQPGDEDGVRLLEPVEALNKVLIEQTEAESKQLEFGENETGPLELSEAVNRVLVDLVTVEAPNLHAVEPSQNVEPGELVEAVKRDDRVDKATVPIVSVPNLGQDEIELEPAEAVNHVLVDHAKVIPDSTKVEPDKVELDVVVNSASLEPEERLVAVNHVPVDQKEATVLIDFDLDRNEVDLEPVEAVNHVLVDHVREVPEPSEPEANLNPHEVVSSRVEDVEPKLNKVEHVCNKVEHELNEVEPVEAINHVLVDQAKVELHSDSRPVQSCQDEVELEGASDLSESPIHPDALHDAELSDGTEDLEFVLNSANHVADQSQSTAHITKCDAPKYDVPKLVDLIQNNDALMDYIIDRYDTESSAAVTPQPPHQPTTTPTIDPIEKTKEFLRAEHDQYEDSRRCEVAFDLSSDQDEVMPNSLTHSSVFTASGIKSLQELAPDVIIPSDIEAYSSLNLFTTSSPVKDHHHPVEQKKLYSLETWDNFLGKAFDDQENGQLENAQLFDSFSSEPHSLLIVETSSSSSQGDKTFTVKSADDTYIVDVNDIDVELDDGDEIHRDNGCGDGSWESSGGWFLHPQSNSEDISGEITVQPGTSAGSYVGGYKMDDEIMAAVRNELMNKLPQAQGASLSTGIDDDDLDSFERNEVFLRYNVYNTPLSPIPEESMLEENSCENTPRQQDSDNEGDDGDWSEHDTTEHPESAQMESPTRGPQHRHTPSQDSCCSNDTLFNLEELNIHDNIERCETESPTLKENDTHQESRADESAVSESKIVARETAPAATPQIREPEDKTYIEEFLLHERNDGCFKDNSSNQSPEEQSSNSDKLLPFVSTKHVAPLPSPEDKPAWKQMPLSLSSPPQEESQEVVVAKDNNVDYVNLQERYGEYENVIGDDDDEHKNFYEDVSTNIDDIYNEADYVNIVNLENSKNSAKLVVAEGENNAGSDKNLAEYVEYDDALIIPNEDDGDVVVEHDVFGVLTDIRFNGPGDSQLMTTSFSESNDLNDEQDWDSGSDTRSSSSGEFIWKEGEHEESLKALRAAPQDVLEDMKPMEGIREETYSSSESSTSGSDEEGESPEFVPSAWDKYATPTKSALRSPEKTLEKTEKKSKGVWFKKQKYHCVYEYPREPDSPVMHTLWTPQQDYSAFADWDLDQSDAFAAVPTQETSSSDDNAGEFQSATATTQNLYYQPKASRNLNLYQLSSVPDFISSSGSSLDDEFFISSSAKPFDIINGLSSQFFPGNNWTTTDLSKNDNITPDSGVEDITPAGTTETEFSNGMSQKRSVPSLKALSSSAVAKKLKKTTTTTESEPKPSGGGGEVLLGGLRHTRNKLKLDLPPSPSAFTSSKIFSIEAASTNNLDPVISREKPTFTTFGKSRFLVQHVDTPPDDDDEASSNHKNVSFEAIPYKPPPLEKHIINDDLDDKSRTKVEVVRGEASLLDSADEDSGIESSTLERKLSTTVD